MKQIVLCIASMLALSALCVGEDFKNVSVVDTMCAQRAKANPDAHTRKCALACVKTGYSVITSDGKVLKLDKAGSEQVAQQLKASVNNDHIRADVSGKVKGDTLQASSVKLL